MVLTPNLPSDYSGTFSQVPMTLPSWWPKSPNGYSQLEKFRETEPDEVWKTVWAAAGRLDLYFLASHILTTRSAPYVENRHQWLYDRYREVQANPDGFCDIWAREHYKSTIITKDLVIFEIINNPELTYGIFSFKAPIAKQFLRNIMYELESNELLKALYPEVLWQNPKREAPKWSEQEGIIVKRQGNPKEATIEAHGLVEGQPTSKHFDIKIYDDCVTLDNVGTDDQIKKTSDAFRLSNNLGKEGGADRVIGTRYHRYDLYWELMDKGAFTPRIYPCKEHLGTNKDGEAIWGDPVLYTPEYLEQKRVTQGPFTFAAQMLCDPVAEEVAGFKLSWLRYYDRDPWREREGKNVYILVDPASSKKDDSDYTAIVVIGLGSDHNYYVLDMVRERLNLTERVDRLFALVERWQPVPGGVVYEKYGKDSDIEHIQYVQEHQRGYRFQITEAGGTQRKEERIRRLVPIMEQGRTYFPHNIPGKDEEGRTVNLLKVLIDHELEPFPVGKHDDMLDAMSRIFDANAIFPTTRQMRDRYQPKREQDFETVDWMVL